MKKRPPSTFTDDVLEKLSQIRAAKEKYIFQMEEKELMKRKKKLEEDSFMSVSSVTLTDSGSFDNSAYIKTQSEKGGKCRSRPQTAPSHRSLPVSATKSRDQISKRHSRSHSAARSRSKMRRNEVLCQMFFSFIFLTFFSPSYQDFICSRFAIWTAPISKIGTKSFEICQKSYETGLSNSVG